MNIKYGKNKIKTGTKFWSEDVKERERLKKLGVTVRIILKWI